MSESANVRAIQTLSDIKTALGQFEAVACAALASVEQEIRHTLDWLQERLNHWQNEVRRRQEEVRLAKAALARCQASGSYDREGHYHPPYCGDCEQDLRKAEIRLQEADAELRNVQQWMRAVGEAVAAYRTQAQRLGRLLATDIPRAGAFLERKIAELQKYLEETPPSSSKVIAPTALQYIVGNPQKDAQFYHKQHHCDTCAIVAQEGIIHKRTGVDPGEEFLRQEAQKRGWYNRGTFAPYVGKLLELYGIPVERRWLGSLEGLTQAVEQEQYVIVVVDAGILWQDERYRRAGHAVWVTGLERNIDGKVVAVYVNDSGNIRIDGGGRIPVDLFVYAWAAQNGLMVTTRC
jgi:hypothetical protein